MDLKSLLRRGVVFSTRCIYLSPVILFREFFADAPADKVLRIPRYLAPSIICTIRILPATVIDNGRFATVR